MLCPSTDALGCLNAALDAAGIPRKELADTLGVSEQTLSKMSAGTQAFGVTLLDAISDGVLEDFLRCYGRERGFEVRRITSSEINDELLGAVRHLMSVMRLRDVRGRQVKADLQPSADARRRA